MQITLCAQDEGKDSAVHGDVLDLLHFIGGYVPLFHDISMLDVEM